MAEFLTTSAKFKCSGSPAVKFQVIESSNTKVTYKNKLVLTDKVQLLGAGNCVKLAMQLGVPSAPCVCMLMPVWKGADKNKTIGRTNLLTSDAKNFCSTAGGKISVADSGGSRLIRNEESAVRNEELKEVERLKGEKVESKLRSNFSPVHLSNNYELGVRNEESTFNLSTFPSFHLSKTDEFKFRCQSCSKNCKFKMSGSFEEHISVGLPVENSSAKLSDNYLQGNDLQKNSSVTYAAHHILPGNQVLKQFPMCYYVANLSVNLDDDEKVFDVNCAENCIMLLTKYQGGAVAAMQEFKTQWHSGGHAFKNKIPLQHLAKVRAKLPAKFKYKPIQDYVTALNAEMQKIESGIDKNDICPAMVRQRLLNLIEKVRSYISAFSKNPADSYPYFVSREAFCYAFGLPVEE